MRSDKDLKELRQKTKKDFLSQFGHDLDDFHIRTIASQILQKKIHAFLYSRLEHLPIHDLMNFIKVAFEEGSVSQEEPSLLESFDKAVEEPKRRGRPKKLA